MKVNGRSSGISPASSARRNAAASGSSSFARLIFELSIPSLNVCSMNARIWSRRSASCWRC
jgi:hypothetical protein